MNQPQFDQLLQTALERGLTPEELAQLDGFLAQNHLERSEFEAVDQLLAKLPDVTVSSNFTHRVMDVVRREVQPPPALGLSWWQRLLAPQYRIMRLGSAAAVVLLVTVLSFQSHLSQDRAEMAESLQTVATIAEIAPELFVDFDAIDAINQSDSVDEELWAALQ